MSTLEAYWWHRLLKVLGIALALLAGIIGGLGTLNQATKPIYQKSEVMPFREFLRALNEKAKVRSKLDNMISAAGTYDAFLGGYNAGCQTKDRVEIVPEFVSHDDLTCIFAETPEELGAALRKLLPELRGFSDVELTTRYGLGLVCFLNESVCSGSTTRLVRYKDAVVTPRFGVLSATRVGGIAIASAAVTFAAFWAFYKYVLLYLLFGPSRIPRPKDREQAPPA